jgi:hypothetical protein
VTQRQLDGGHSAAGHPDDGGPVDLQVIQQRGGGVGLLGRRAAC